MGSKKHKKDSKKKKHRSRSRSPLDNGEERERKRHRKHKDRKKDRSPDVEEVPVDSHLRSRSRSDSSERARARDRERRGAREPPENVQSADSGGHAPPAKARSPSPAGAANAATSGGGHDNLSVEDTNKLRAKLGLKPLEQAEKPAEDGKLKDDLGEFYHRPAADLAQQRRQDKLRERLEVRQEKRKLEQKLQAAPLGAGAGAGAGGAGSDDEDAAAWVRKSREAQKLKQEAAKRAAMLDELDAEFGVGALVAAEAGEARASAYGPGHLRGLRVAHDINQIAEEREMILTLEDKEVLADSAEDVLVNVNMVDDQRYKKNILERKKALTGYQAYDDSSDALGLPRSVLGKYDDEIDQGRASRDAGFVLGDEDAAMAAAFRDEVRRSRAMGALGIDGVNRRLESLWMPEPQRATEYYDEHEMQAKFKKFKKKGKSRKKAKHEPIDVEAYDAADAPLDTDDTDVQPSSVTLAVDEDEVEPDGELQAAVARARRLRLAAAAAAGAGDGDGDGDGDAKPIIPKVEDLLSHVKSEPSASTTVKEEEETEADPDAMVLDATAEFCRTLGDIPTYGQAGNRDHHAEIMELEREETEEAEAAPAADGAPGAWSRVDVGSEKPPDLAAGSLGGLEAEPALGAGVMGALRLALSKGYLEKAGAAPTPRSNVGHLLAARHYSIEDKTYGEDDKHGRRERGYSGPVQEFREKSHFRPTIKLEYADDDGRPLCPKEAFRYLSHKFHGKGPGKNKQEKRIKKAVQEGLMKKMSSTDTPLNTLQMLQDKQRETHSPYVVLSGAKRDAPH